MDAVAEGNDLVTVNGQNKHVAGYLQDFLFESDRLRVPVSTLSGGERNRLLLAKLFTRPSNVLIMDEPTNDLDVETLELLEEMLDAYQGTVLLVSHDREFLDNLVTSTLALEGDGLVHDYVGGYTDWLNQRGATTGKHKKNALTSKPTIIQTETTKKRKLSYKEQKEQENLQAELDAFPSNLEKLEKEQIELEAKLVDDALFSKNPELFNATVKRLPLVEAAQIALLERFEQVEKRLQELSL